MGETQIKDINTEVQWLINSIETLVDTQPFSTLQAELLHTRLTHSLAQLQNSYLSISEQTILSLSDQSQNLKYLRGNVLMLLGLIGTAIVIMISLLMWSYQANSHLRATRKELALQSDLLQAAFDSIDQGFAVWDKDDRLVAWNDKCLDFWYLPADVSVGMLRLDLLRHLAKSNAFGEGDPEILANQQLKTLHDLDLYSEEEIQLHDGRFIILHRYPMPEGGMAVVYTDISEQKSAEIALIDSRHIADNANKAKSEFLSSMSHELRTPMNAILGFAQMLEYNPKEPLTQAQKDCVARILAGGEHLLELINQVLDLAKIEAGKITYQFEDIAVDAALNECRGLIEPIAEKYEITVTLDVSDKDLPHVVADSTRMKQVLLNILSNAIKYNTPDGSVVITSTTLEDGFQRISIADTGRGIPTEQLTDLFKPFSRLAAENSEIEGTGIGLTITRQLVEQMNGRIDLKSTVGEGTVFWVDLPLAKAAGTVETTDPSVGYKAASELPDIIGTILYIEDNPANLELMKMIVSRLNNLELISAHTAEIGIELAECKQPDLIIMDINLPGMNGFQALQKLLANPQTNDIPVIAISANAMPADIEKGQKAGFRNYLTKPINIEETLASIKEQIDGC